MAQPNLQEIHDVLVDIAKRAGEKITSARPSVGAIDTKKNSSDLVTETDQAVEHMVSTTLKEKYPDYSFMGEESYVPGTRLTPAPTFVCDPIDGTTNFVHAYPYVSISLAFVHNLLPCVGVVYNPFTQELYHGIRGHGAYLTRLSSAHASTLREVGTKVDLQDGAATFKLPLKSPPEPLDGLDKALVAIEWGSERNGSNFEVKLKTFASLAAEKQWRGNADGAPGAMVHSLRSLGSAALNLCAVATGSLDAYWEGGCWAWDVAAGWVLLEESGGLIVGANRGEWEPGVDARRYLAVRAAKGGADEGKRFVEEFWSHVKGTLEYTL